MSNREITIYDIAEQLKISAATVSRALKDDPVVKEKTRKKVLEMADKLGYRQNTFASSLRSKKTNVIGVIVPRLASNFMSSAISGIEKVANAEGYNILISQSDEQRDKEIANARTMFANRVDGLLVSLAYYTEDIDHFEPFFKKNISVVFFDRVEEHKDSTSILIDNRGAAYNATKHLIEQGCKHIVHITAIPKRNVYADRLKGYRSALADNKIKFKEDDVIYCNLTQQAGAEAAQKILAMKPLPDGIFSANDTCAAGCMIELKKSGIQIPGDIAVAGFNNDPVATIVEPNLTTINYSGFQAGEVAARSLINFLKDNYTKSTASIILKSELIVRDSSRRRTGE